jgi:putative aldouronate transport system permease protein
MRITLSTLAKRAEPERARAIGIPGALKKDLRRNAVPYLIVLPALIYYAVFCYAPMYGALIAFQNYTPAAGIGGSDWVGLKHFVSFFQGLYFKRVLVNTVKISLGTLIFGFPAPIILALLINELAGKRFKQMVQTVTYLPHFISMVVICGMIKSFVSNTGLITYIMTFFGREPSNMLQQVKLFLPIYVLSDIWQECGWGSIIYLSALSAINPELYEAATIDGAGRWRQTLHVTLPGIQPTIVILLILRIGSLMSVSSEKILLLYNPVIYDGADVISTYVYRKGLQEQNWSFSSAVGLFNSLINFTLLIAANTISKKVNETSLW